MRKITTLFALMFCASLAFGQTIEKSQAIMIYDTVPTVAPCTYCSERAFVRADNTEYWWDGDSWEKWYDGNSYLTSLVQDSILVTTRFGIEVNRDTIPLGGGTGGGSVTTIAADSVTLRDVDGYFATDNAEFAFADLALRSISITNALGIADYATAFGTFTGSMLPDNQTAKQLFQVLETATQDNIDSLAAHLVRLNALDGKLDTLTFTPAADTSYTVVRQYSAASIVGLDTIYFPEVSGGSGSGDLLAANNLSDVDDVATARSNLGADVAANIDIVDAGGYYIATDVEGALQEEAVNRIALDALIGDLVTLSGVAATSEDFGTFTGSILTDNQAAKPLYQQIEDELQAHVDSIAALRGDIGTGGGGGIGGSISNTQIAYGDASGDIQGSSDYVIDANGFNLFSGLKIGKGAGTNSLVQGITSAASSGSNWIAQGTNAGASNTSGSNWIAQGTDAGGLNTTGSDWIAQGAEAAESSTTGDNFLAQGPRAGQNNTIGRFWIAQGRAAGRFNIDGDDWVAQGYSAALFNESGDGFIAQGRDASFSNVTGSYFVSTGYQNSSNATSGSNYVSIGYRGSRSLNGGGSVTSLGNGVYIGEGTLPGANGASNEIVIGPDAFGRGANSASIGNNSTLKTYLSTTRFRPTATASRPVGEAGLFGWNSTTLAFDGHNGTSFGRLYPSSDATPTNGQVGVFDSSLGLYVPTTLSSGTMSSWDIDTDSASPSTVDDGETVTIIGDGVGIDTQNSGNTVQVKLDLSEIPAQTSLGGNEYTVFYDVTNGNQLTHIDTLLNYIVDNFELSYTDGAVQDSAWITLPNSKYWRFESDGGVTANIGNFAVTTPLFSVDGAVQFLDAFGGGDQKITVSTLGLVSYSSDDRALVSSLTANRPPMYTGTGNEMSSFPMELTGTTTKFTQTTSVQIPTGGTAFEGTPADGSLRYDADTDQHRMRRDGEWLDDAAKDDIFAETYTGYTGNSSGTITPFKNIFIQAVIGTGDTYTLTIDDTDVPAGAYMDVINSGAGDLVLDRSSGNFVTTTGSPATITLTDDTARFVFSGSAWYQIH